MIRPLTPWPNSACKNSQAVHLGYVNSSVCMLIAIKKAKKWNKKGVWDGCKDAWWPASVSPASGAYRLVP